MQRIICYTAEASQTIFLLPGLQQYSRVLNLDSLADPLFAFFYPCYTDSSSAGTYTPVTITLSFFSNAPTRPLLPCSQMDNSCDNSGGSSPRSTRLTQCGELLG